MLKISRRGALPLPLLLLFALIFVVKFTYAGATPTDGVYSEVREIFNPFLDAHHFKVGTYENHKAFRVSVHIKSGVELDPNYSHDQMTRLREFVKSVAIPPRSKNTYVVKEETLGTLYIVADTIFHRDVTMIGRLYINAFIADFEDLVSFFRIVLCRK